MTERRYDDEQVALILRRAADDTSAQGDQGRGLTLTDLKEIGSEAGIDPARIEAAATSLAHLRDGPPEASFTGFPPTIQFEQVIPVRLEAEVLPQLLDIIRNQTSRQGIVTEVLGGFEWKARSTMGGRYVSIRSEGDATRVRVLGNYRDGLLTMALGPGPLLAIGGGLGAAALAATPLVVVPAVLAAWGSLALPWRALFKREAKSLQGILERIERRLHEVG